MIVVCMVDVRCTKFNSDMWAYVTKYAELKRISRCEALERIVEEHMKIVAEAQRRLYEKGKKSV